MNTVMMIPNAFPAAIPPYAGPQGGAWRPASGATLRAYPISRPGVPHWRPGPIQLGQTQQPASASLAKAADVAFSLIAAVGAMTIGIVAMTVGIGGDPKASPPVKPPATWKWIGGITAALGALMIVSNVSKISKASEMVSQTTQPTVSVPVNQ